MGLIPTAWRLLFATFPDPPSQPPDPANPENRVAPFILASSPASILNLTRDLLGIPLRFQLTQTRSKGMTPFSAIGVAWIAWVVSWAAASLWTNRTVKRMPL